jgi:hypothetical protein
VNAPAVNVAGVKAMLLDMAAETRLLVREQLAGLPNGPERFKLVRLVTTDLTALRRGDHSAERLVLDRERLAFERECVERAKVAEFWKWTKSRRYAGNYGRQSEMVSRRKPSEKLKGS